MQKKQEDYNINNNLYKGLAIEKHVGEKYYLPTGVTLETVLSVYRITVVLVLKPSYRLLKSFINIFIQLGIFYTVIDVKMLKY